MAYDFENEHNTFVSFSLYFHLSSLVSLSLCIVFALALNIAKLLFSVA
jgi:hypothetical protein